MHFFPVTGRKRGCATRLLTAIAFLAGAASAAAEPLRFAIDDATTKNVFFRNGAVAAHLVTTSGQAPRLVVAFPAGNSGVAVFLDAADDANWSSAEHLRGVTRATADGVLNGVEFDISLSSSARLKQALIGDIRTIRLFVDAHIAPPDETRTAPTIDGQAIVWERKRVDGRPGYLLSIEVKTGGLRMRDNDVVAFEAEDGAPVALHVTALTGDKPLTPIPGDRLLSGAANDDASFRTLAFLSYREKLLAGSWRFLTYFGRDTLLTLKLFSRSAASDLVEAGLSSVLERLNGDGEVAHEEAIGEFAVLAHRRDGEPASEAPLFDYKMIDDDFMLAPALADYLLDSPVGIARAATFLDKTGAGDVRFGDLVVRNLKFVINRTSAFARDPSARTLISLKEGEVAGNWRDSEEGLGGGRYPFDVNVALVPAALEATARLADSGLLAPYLDGEDNGLADARDAARIWRESAPQYFLVALDRREAQRRRSRYARQIGVPAPELTSTEGPFEFYALALDGNGQPIPVLHSDIAFSLAYGEPDRTTLARMIDSIDREFPAGLFTDAGMLVANPGLVKSKTLRSSFDNTRYHGAVVWSWQQALMAYGVDRQLRRGDIDAATRERLARAKKRVWSAICATQDTRLSELWSWTYTDDGYRIEPFGRRGDATESNAAQLWSTVYLGVAGLESCRRGG